MAEETAVAPTTTPKPQTDPLHEIVRAGRFYKGLSVGLKEVIRCLESRDALLCVLAADCDNKEYVALITALCKETKVPIYKFEGGQRKLGEYLGFCKLDKDGTPRKVVRCSSFVARQSLRGIVNFDTLGVRIE